ncbi:hypothetical protein, partial [Halolamina salina]|uniref:hypothetical protein n=1 Tax=Halolamina salina TaxID=1220023 RepID=UPI0036D226BE
GPATTAGPRGRGGDSALRRASCPAHCGRKWSSIEMLSRLLSDVPFQHLGQNSPPDFHQF